MPGQLLGGHVPGAVGKGRGRGVAVQPCRLPVSWLYRLSHRVEAPLARPLLLAAGTCEVSGTAFPPELEATRGGRALETPRGDDCLPAAPPRGPHRDQGSGLGRSPSTKPALRAGGGSWGAGGGLQSSSTQSHRPSAGPGPRRGLGERRPGPEALGLEKEGGLQGLTGQAGLRQEKEPHRGPRSSHWERR